MQQHRAPYDPAHPYKAASLDPEGHIERAEDYLERAETLILSPSVKVSTKELRLILRLANTHALIAQAQMTKELMT